MKFAAICYLQLCMLCVYMQFAAICSSSFVLDQVTSILFVSQPWQVSLSRRIWLVETKVSKLVLPLRLLTLSQLKESTHFKKRDRHQRRLKSLREETWSKWTLKVTQKLSHTCLPNLHWGHAVFRWKFCLTQRNQCGTAGQSQSRR